MSVGSERRADRINRQILTVLALLVAVGAGLGLVAGYGLFGDVEDHPVISRNTIDAVDDFTVWLWIAIGLLMLLVAVLALRWILSQVNPIPAEKDIPVDSGEAGEPVKVSARAATDALAEEVRSIDGVDKAGARMRSGDSPRTIDLWVEVADGYPIAPVRAAIADQCLPRLVHALGTSDIETSIEFRPTEHRAAVARVQ